MICHGYTLIFLMLLSIQACSTSTSPKFFGYITPSDKSTLETLFTKHIDDGLKDLSKLYFILLGYRSLSLQFPRIEDACLALDRPITSSDLAFYIFRTSKLLGPEACKLSLTSIKSFVKSNPINKLSAEDMFYIISAMKDAGLKIDTAEVVDAVNKLLTKDATPSVIAFLLQSVTKINLPKTDLGKYMANLNEMLDQASELDGVQLFYEKGVYTTAMVAKATLGMIESYGEIPAYLESKLIKLFNFLYSRRLTSNLRAAAHVISAFRILARSSIYLPLVIQAVDQPMFSSSSLTETLLKIHRDKPMLHIQIVNIWGEPQYGIEDVRLKALALYSANKSISHDKTIITPADLGEFQKGNNAFDFQLSLGPDINSIPPNGFYMLDLAAQNKKINATEKILGVNDIQVPILLVTEVIITQPSITISDHLHGQHIADISLQFGKVYKALTSNGAIIVELGHQLALEFLLTDKFNTIMPVIAHQVFVQFTHEKTQAVVTFLCNEISSKNAYTPGSKNYRFVLDPDSSAADFDHQSGLYRAELVIGDPLIRNPIVWHMFDVDLHFVGTSGSEAMRRMAQATDASRQHIPSHAGSKFSTGLNPIIGSGPTTTKPEIDHMFRKPEKRAPAFIALLFTGLCVLPLLGLAITWIHMRINVSNFRFGLSNLLFHAGLIGIFVLYYVYWRCLDMFTTLGYLVILGVPTFLAGNSMLRGQVVAKQRAVSSINTSSKK